MKKTSLFITPLLAIFLLANCGGGDTPQPTPQIYTIIWKNDDGSTLEIDKDVPYGTIPHYDGETPTKPKDAQYTYTFSGWDKDITKGIEGDTTFTAQYSSATNKYTVTWKNDDGSILKAEQYEYGTMPQYSGDAPTSTITKLGYTSSFSGWDKDIQKVMSDATYTATYSYNPECLELPIMEIFTDDGKPITSKEIYKDAHISLSNTKDEYKLDNIAIKIRGRGNSTWNLPKKPYRIKFDKKISMFGTEYKAKNWVLLANYSDKTLVRNMLAYELSRQLPHISFSSVHIPVDVYLNGEYNGVYLFCDQIDVNKGRVDIDDNVSADGNNGFLIERDHRAPNEGELNIDYFISNNEEYAIKSPDTDSQEYLDNVDKEILYISSYFNSCFSALDGNDWNSIKELMDIDSFADSYIIDELFANPDCGVFSFYYYKDKDGKLFRGPLWDFDLGAGNGFGGMGSEESVPPDEKLWAAYKVSFYKKFLNHNEFKEAVKNRLTGYEDIINSALQLLDSKNPVGYYAMYNQSFNRNFIRWDIMGKYVWPEPEDVYTIDTLDGQMEFLKTWLTKRYDFIVKTFSNY